LYGYHPAGGIKFCHNKFSRIYNLFMINGDLRKTSNFVEIAEGEKLSRRNIAKYFEDLILSLTYAAAASAKRRS